ncbi:MAG: hypothetical protein HFF70_13275 [Oscillospiraceae bacterium]|nr:hypothetical protein [Oscillospiraceae bacterium]
MNLPMNLRDLNLWNQKVLRGFALPHNDGTNYHIGDAVGIQEPFRRLLVVEDTADLKQQKVTAGVIYRSDGEYAWAKDATANFQEAKRWSPASQLPDYAIRYKATVTKFEVKPLQSFTDEDIQLLCLDYASQQNPQILLPDFVPIKNFELLFSWWQQHYRRTLKDGDNPTAVIFHLVSTT